MKNCSKLKIAKIQDSKFVRTTEKKIQKRFEKIQKWLEDWRFEVFAPIGSHINENEKKKAILENCKCFFFLFVCFNWKKVWAYVWASNNWNLRLCDNYDTDYRRRTKSHTLSSAGTVKQNWNVIKCVSEFHQYHTLCITSCTSKDRETENTLCIY